MVKLNRPHIGIFGRMNAGKSSLVNVLSGQDTALVSAVAGTTTDPVKKIMEILGVGPVTLIDTAGLDDASELGAQRVAKTKEILDQVNLAIIVFSESFGGYEKELAALCRARGVPFFFVHNKSDIYSAAPSRLEKTDVIEFSCRGGDAKVLLDAVRKHLPQSAYAQDDIFGGFVQENDEVVLVMPIDASFAAGAGHALCAGLARRGHRPAAAAAGRLAENAHSQTGGNRFAGLWFCQFRGACFRTSDEFQHFIFPFKRRL